MSEPEFSAFIFEAHDLNKFEKYIDIPHVNGFSLPTDPNGKVYLLDEQNGWSDHNGCYYNENGVPDGWIVLSNDGGSFLKFNMQKVVTQKGKNVLYSSNHYKVNLKQYASQNNQNKVEENKQQQNQQSQIKKPKNQSKIQGAKEQQNKQEKQDKEKKQGKQEKQEQQKSQIQKKNKKQQIEFHDDQQQIYPYQYDYSKQAQFVEKEEALKDQQESQQQQKKEQSEEETQYIEKKSSQVDENQKQEKRERKPRNQDNKNFRRDKKNKNRNDENNENQENQENQKEKENQKHYNLSVKENQLSKDDFLKHLQEVYEIKTKNVILFENEILQLVDEKDAVKIYLKNKNERKDQKQKFIISI